MNLFAPLESPDPDSPDVEVGEPDVHRVVVLVEEGEARIVHRNGPSAQFAYLEECGHAAEDWGLDPPKEPGLYVFEGKLKISTWGTWIGEYEEDYDWSGEWRPATAEECEEYQGVED